VDLPRFYVSPGDWRTDSPAIIGPEAHHARDVLRLRVGDQALLFNGHGRELVVEVTEVNRREIRFRTVEENEAPPRLTWITLAQAIPKGKNMDLIVQKAVELGAAEVVPILSERTVVSLDKKETVSKQAKWQQIVVEAGKQCGQSWLPDVAKPRSLKEFFQAQKSDVRRQRSEEVGISMARAPSKAREARALPGENLRLVASLQDDSLHLKEVLRKYEATHGARPTRVTVLIGPEGDFTPAEHEAARDAGFQPITLGSIVLRVETAAIYCLSVLSYELLGEES
jgi:16S rRNA (uracil1498-N3)-methyltransferase